jgi:hypothetical protein
MATPDEVRSGKRGRPSQRRSQIGGGVKPGQGERDAGDRHDEGDQQRQMNRIGRRQSGRGQPGKGAGHVTPMRATGMAHRMRCSCLRQHLVTVHRHGVMRRRRSLGHRSAARAQDDRRAALNGPDHIARRHDQLEQQRRRAEQHGEMALREQASNRRHASGVSRPHQACHPDRSAHPRCPALADSSIMVLRLRGIFPVCSCGAVR